METQVLIIGGGATGTGIARDLALRGVNCILAERRDINAGASGGNHGLLHSGARYVAHDAESAQECKHEGDILKRLAPHCIEDTGGLFVAVRGDDETYIADFPNFCARSGIPVRSLDVAEARMLEPALSEDLIAAYQVQDASVDPFRLSLENISQAQSLGATYLRHSKVVGFDIDGRKIKTVHLENLLTGEKFTIRAKQIVNATGAWAAGVAAMAGAHIDMTYSKGTLLVTHTRITQRVINRLRPPGDGDILVPGGTVSILGTTSVKIENLDDIQPTFAEVDLNVEQGAIMVPALETIRYIRAYTGVRPLLGSGGAGGGRSISRSFACLDHEQDGLDNLATITGGKLTTYRLMAEKTTDLVCARLGNTNPCLTAQKPLPAAQSPRWTEPGLTPRLWLKNHTPEDILLCECEMVPKSVVDSIVTSFNAKDDVPTLLDIGRRSRIGKGSCQGAFCGHRVLAYLYDQGLRHKDQGIEDLKQFLRVRWKGERPMLWDMPIVQAELQEALHCGIYCLELSD